MAWIYVATDTQEVDDTMCGKVLNALNGITHPAELMSVKIGTCDSLSWDPVTTVYYLSGATEIPDPSTLGTTWSYQNFSNTYSDDYLWQQVVDFLNSETNKLTDTQKFWSQVSMSDRNDGAAHAIVWYRNQT